jgi:outer membrane protein assembly factor BamD
MKQVQILFLVSIVALTSCAKWWHKDEERSNPFRGMPEQVLYRDAQKAMKKKQYASAIKRLEAMESMYPFSDNAENAQMQLIYAYYKNEDYAAAAATAERFIHLYPRAKNVDYAYYLKALANFQQTRGVLAKFLPMDESWRDPGTQSQAYTDFAVLIQRFPDSKYKPNSLQRMIYLRNMFAQSELNVSKYYFKRRMFVAAIERSKHLIKNYSQAPSTAEALVIIYKSNRILGFDQAAEEAKRVYEATYHRPLNDRR